MAGLALLLVSLLAVAHPAPASAAPTLPTGYKQEVAVGGFNLPTNIAWRADGALYVVEKGGKVYLTTGGAKKLVYDLEAGVNDYWDRGMLGIEVDRFDGSLYLLYTKENSSGYGDDKTAGLVRVTMSGDTPVSTTPILGTDSTTATRSCKDMPETADCIPSDSPSHTIGLVKQAPDGALYVTTGDGSRFDSVDPAALRAQHLDSLAGKVLRIDRDGRGLPDNPFFTGDASANRSKVYAYGMRNAFRGSLQPGTTHPVVGDVQWGDNEEVDHIRPGRNYGWPCYQGDGINSGYDTLEECRALYAQGAGAVTPPLVHYRHNGSSAAVVGGDFYEGSGYPGVPQGAYFYSDYHHGFLKYLTVGADGALTSGPVDFAGGLEGPVALEFGPDGNLYYVSILSGNIYRLVYSETPSSCAEGEFTAAYYSNVSLSGVPSARACTGSVNFSWGAGSPDPAIPADNFSASFTGTKDFPAAGTYEFSATADDGVRLYVDDQLLIDKWVDQAPTTYTARRTLSAGSHKLRLEYYERGGGAEVSLSWRSSEQAPPAVSIDRPAHNAKAAIGSTVEFAGSATDPEDGAIPGSRLKWELSVQHCPGGADDCHTHPLLSHTGSTGSFTYPDHGADPYFVRLRLHATDSSGLAATAEAALYPQAPADSACAAGQYRAEYFEGAALAGTPVVTGCTDAVSYDWGKGAPDPALPADGFSARWTAKRTFEEGTYRFSMTGDDGVRLFIDGASVPGMDQWKDQAASSYSADVPLTDGDHEIRFEYYENGGDAVARLEYAKTSGGATPAPAPETGWRGEYWSTPAAGTSPGYPAGAPDLTRTDNDINFSWGSGSPDPVIPADKFMVKWTGRRSLPAGTYGISTTADDGIRVLINGALVHDNWQDQAPTTRTSQFRQAADGTVEIVVWYYENGGGSVAQFGLAKAADAPPPPVSEECAAGQYRAELFSGQTLSGSPLTVLCTDAINYDLGTGSPDPAVPADSFSGRWTASRSFEAGTYSFQVTADDGVRVFIDGSLVTGLDQWKPQSATTYTADIALAAGVHEIRVEYYEATGDAVLKFSYGLAATPAPEEGSWLGEYWSMPGAGTSPALPTGSPQLSRSEAAINFDWGSGSPAAGIPADGFAARWSRSQTLTPGTYRITTTADDGIRVYVDGVLVHDYWVDQAPTTQTSTFTVDATRTADIVVWYYENGGGAVARYGLSRL